MPGVLVMVCEKDSKSNKTRIFDQSCQDIWILFLDLELEQALFYVKKLPSWNTTDFTYHLSYTIVNKNFILFSHLKTSITHLLIDFTTLEGLF